MSNSVQTLRTTNLSGDLQGREDLCRLCLATKAEDSVFIFDEGASGYKYAEIATSLMNIHIEQDDLFPKCICWECASTLLVLHQFKEKCESSEYALRTLFNNHREHDSDQTSDEPNNSQSQQQLGEALINVFSRCTPTEHALETSLDEVITPACAGEHKCLTCGQIFTRKSSLFQHYTIHTGEKRFSCQLCKERFTRKSHVNIHMRRHTNEKPYTCSVCPAAFRKSSDLYRHEKVHSDRRNYVCEICGRTFKRSTDISNHMNSHTGRKPYKCKRCPKEYSAHSSMMKHCRKFNHV